jgi:hypothetical protein
MISKENNELTITPDFNIRLAVPEGQLVLDLIADLLYFEVDQNCFVKIRSNIKVNIIKTAPFEFTLSIGYKKPIICQLINNEMNPFASSSDNTFNWVYYKNNAPCHSWSLKFPTQCDFQFFIGFFFGCVFEASNKTSYADINGSELEYITEAIKDYEIDSSSDASEEDTDEEDEEDESVFTGRLNRLKEEENIAGYEVGSRNSLLEVGYKHNRSFVVRGNKIGVFKHTDDEDLEFDTAISNIGTKKGASFSPTKMMLHNQDSSMIMMKPEDEFNLYLMDLEYGKVVEEWKVDDYRKVNDIVPDKKYNQQTADQIILGFNDTGIFRIDGRLSGNKIATDSSYQYQSKVQLSCAATTGSGHFY